ncbi:MAG: biotin transporter BioY [Tuberibacillus sp.]
MKFKTIDLLLAALFAALMGIGANLASFLPAVSGVPLTFQTVIAILAGAVLGSRLGAVSMTVYMLIGLVGAPIFAGFTGGPSTIFGNTFGFILSFIVLAYAVGKIIEKSKQPTFPVFLLASVVGLVINYLIGTTYMYAALNLWIHSPLSYKTAWVIMFPFLIKDAILTFVIAVVASRIYQSVGLSLRNKKTTHAA